MNNTPNSTPGSIESAAAGGAGKGKGERVAKAAIMTVVLLLTAAAVAACFFKARFCASSNDGGALLDLRGCEVSDERYTELSARLADVQIVCDVTLGEKTFSSDITELRPVPEDGVDVDALAQSADRLTLLTVIDLARLPVTAEQYEAVCAAYPQARVEWTVPAAGGLDSEVSEVALTSMNDLRDVIGRLGYLPKLKKIDMTGAALSDDEARELSGFAESHGLDVVWSVTVAGTRYPSDTASLTLTGEGVTDLSELARLPRLAELTLDGVGTGDLSPLAGIQTLLSLVVRDTKIDDVMALSGMTWLQSFLVEDAGVAQWQLDGLHEALPGCVMMML